MRRAALAGVLNLVLGATLLVAGPALANVQEASRLLKAGQREQALEQVNKVLAGKPRDPQARFLKGIILTEQGNTKDAIEIFLKLTQDYPDLPEPYNNLAVIHAAQGQYDKARAALEQSIRTHPSYATAYENLGDVYAKLASQAYDRALQLDSANAGAQNKLALVRELVGTPQPGRTVVAARPAAPEKPAPVAEKPAAPVVEKPAAKPAPEKPAPVTEKPAPVAEKPVEKPAAKPAAEKPADVAAEALEAVHRWAKAWSARDVAGYLSHYAKTFKTPDGESRADWEKLRRARVSGPKSISVGIASPKVEVGNGTATVTFRQTYRSDRFTSTGTKTLTLVNEGGKWRIQQEQVSN